MTDDQDAPPEAGEEEQLAPFKLEAARSSRSKCRTCRRSIEKGKLRLGILLEGPYGTGYLWHHLNCAARRRWEDVEAAWADASTFADAAGLDVPDLDELVKLREQAEEQKKNKKELPYADIAPTGRAKCKHCDEPIAKGSYRVVLGRGVEFGRQMRTSPINVHPSCVRAELHAEDCTTELDGFEDALRAHTRDLDPKQLDECLAAIGDLDG